MLKILKGIIAMNVEKSPVVAVILNLLIAGLGFND